MQPSRAPEGPDVLRPLGLDVPRETAERLETYVALVRKWQPAENLVSPSTLPEIWTRHVADSAQLVPLFPDAVRWLDLGSGAGFPGLVVACLIAGRAGAEVHLVESNQRKCAFLRKVVAETGAPATVHQGRIESVLAGWDRAVDVVTARALAPLPVLLDLCGHLLTGPTVGGFPKGRGFASEVTAASKSWAFDLVQHASRFDPDGAILAVSQVVRPPPAG